MAIVSVRNIKKTYNKGKVVALRDLSFDVEEGEIYGIIGLILGDLLMVLIDPRISFGKKEGGR